MSSLFVPDGVAPGAVDASVFVAHAREAQRREKRAQWHLLFILVFVLGPLVVYPLARLIVLSVSGPHGFTLDAFTAFSAIRRRAA